MTTGINLDGSVGAKLDSVATVGFENGVSLQGAIAPSLNNVRAYRTQLDSVLAELSELSSDFSRVSQQELHDAITVLKRSGHDTEAFKDTFVGRVASGAAGGGLVQAAMEILSKI